MLETLEMDAEDVDGELWFRQDGVTADTPRESMDHPRSLFLWRITSRCGYIAWPARYPDFSAPQYFLWVQTKAKVHTNHLARLWSWKNRS